MTGKIQQQRKYTEAVQRDADGFNAKSTAVYEGSKK